MRRLLMHTKFVLRLFQSRGGALLLGTGGSGAALYGFFPFWERFAGSEKEVRPVYIWGKNTHGLVAPDCLGEDVIKFPTRMSFFDGITLKSVATAKSHAAAVDEEGNLYQWGIGFLEGPHDPILTVKGMQLSQVACTEDAILALSEPTQQVFVIPLSGKVKPELSNVQFKKELMNGEKLIKIAAGHDHLVLLGDYGTVQTVALNDRANLFGQLGRGPTEITKKAKDFVFSAQSKLPDQGQLLGLITGGSISEEKIEEPILPDAELYDEFAGRRIYVPSATKIKDIACGDHHTLLLSEDGRVFGFGSNEMLQLGLGSFDKNRALIATPLEISTIWDGGIKPASSAASAIAAGNQTSYIAVDHQDQTTILAVGSGLYGQLGNGTWSHANGNPAKVQRISGLTYFNEVEGRVKPVRCRYITAGSSHVAAVMNTYKPPTVQEELSVPHGDDVYLWGCNRYYQLGLGGRHHNLCRPSSLIPYSLPSSAFDTTSAGVLEKIDAIRKTLNSPPKPILDNLKDEKKLADRLLQLSGPLQTNQHSTLSFAGGQFQLLYGKDDRKPIQEIYCGDDVTIIH